MLIGYQIYNVVEYKQELKKQVTEINELKKKTDELFDTIVKKDYEVQEGFDVVNAFICHLNGGRENSIGSFLSLHHALLSALNANREDYSTIFSLMRRYITEIDWMNFAFGLTQKGNDYFVNDPNSPYFNQSMLDVINQITCDLPKEKEEIQNHKNYCRIRLEYERVMGHYEKRVKSILSDPMKMISNEEYVSIINPS